MAPLQQRCLWTAVKSAKKNMYSTVYSLLLLCLKAPPFISAMNYSQFEPRIYRGYTCSTKQFPFMVQVLKTHSLKWYVICGGTLISSYWVLTAAHCFKYPKNRYAIRTSVDSPSAYPFLMFADNVFLHERYDGRLYANDVALMKLRYPLKKRKNIVSYVQLPRSKISDVEEYCASAGLVIGWGRNEANRTKPLQCAKLPVINYHNCNKVYQKYHGYSVTSRQICTLSQRGVDVCQGDSGGPLLCDSVQIGIISWGIGCAIPTAPSVYTSVDAYLDFINTTMENNNSGSYESIAKAYTDKKQMNLAARI